MTNKRCILIFLILVVTAIVVSACASAETAPPAEEVPPTVTPISPATTAPPAETSTPVPTDTPEPTDEPPAEPTDTPAPTDTAEPTPTPQPRPPRSEGPLDFVQPEWVYMWESQPDGNVKVVVEVEITGGAPPFTIKHDGSVDGKTWGRLYLLDFLHLGCSGIGHTITVESADGQSVTHDYWLHIDRLDWCN